VKLTQFEAQRLLGGLTLLDKDESTKFEPDVRLKIAVNVNRLTPHVLAFQRIQDKLLRQQQEWRAIAGSQPGLMNGEAVEAVRQIAALDDLKLKDNPKIKSDTIAAMSLLLKDFDDGQGDE
jgi:hypothetical protein